MKLHDLLSALSKRPFSPVRLNVSGGKSDDLHYPELCVAGYNSAFIGFPSQEDAEQPVYARYVIVDLDHIISLEPIPAESAQAN